ncbi:MAG: alpha/beta hydrolase [Betaproteobacteria bacterium]|nr:alpha/beta hydrolase [Betaproteobacteria bacterium]
MIRGTAWVACAMFALAGAGAADAQAPTEVFIAVDTGRSRSDGGGSVPVQQRAILMLPGSPTDASLLYFRGLPGYMLLNSLQDKGRNLGWLGKGLPDLMKAGIALVLVDCPTDQWGENPRPPATNCHNDYRSSRAHADDVRKLMARLREQHGLKRFFILGHSIGSVSSRWLAINLGKDEIAGTIHSATINVPGALRGPLFTMLGTVSSDFPRRAAGAPMLHLHNERDACRVTPYPMVKAYAADNLVTVRGGLEEGDPCGGGHLHSHHGRETEAVRAIINWIRTGTVERVVGE